MRTSHDITCAAMVTQEFHALRCYVHWVQPTYVNETDMSHVRACLCAALTNADFKLDWFVHWFDGSGMQESCIQFVLAASEKRLPTQRSREEYTTTSP